jgi:hypothetical protein
MHLDLSELSQLAPIFRELFKGYHVSRRDPELYAQLSNFQDQYRTLFKALGFELVCDTRGFYYFVPDQAGAAVNKTAQRLALFTFILVEHLADQVAVLVAMNCRRCWKSTATCLSRPKYKPSKSSKKKSCAA